LRKISLIYNPAAKGQKASRQIDRLSVLKGKCDFLMTQRAGHAMKLAAQAALNEVDCVVAVGGDGTIYEVVNGLMRSKVEKLPSLAVIPSGTANVFALEHKLPWQVSDAWNAIEEGKTRLIDLIEVKEGAGPWEGEENIRYVVQLAGAGFDAASLKLVSWELKKKVGKLAYWIAGFRALIGRHPHLTCEWEGKKLSCECALVGNGRYYGGKHILFPHANTEDGLLDVTYFPKLNFPTLFRILLRFCKSGNFCLKDRYTFQTRHVSLQGVGCSFQLEGEWAGNLPVSFRIASRRLPIIVPS
jgi:diacylglycerol kinase (ATP)